MGLLLKEWHYVIHGVAGTPFEGGYYHGENGVLMMSFVVQVCVVYEILVGI